MLGSYTVDYAWEGGREGEGKGGPSSTVVAGSVVKKLKKIDYNVFFLQQGD